MTLSKILLFDTDRRGHHADYITYLIEYHQKNPNFELVIATDERLIQVFKTQFRHTDKLIFEPISITEISLLHQANIFKRSYNEWKLFCQKAEKHQVSQGLLMYFDVFQIGLIFGTSPPCPVSGIYFRPDFHYHAAGFKAILNAFRKKWMLRQMLKKSFLKTLFSLDKTAVELIKPLTEQTNVLPISDPVKVYEKNSSEVDKLRIELGLTNTRKTFLLFGFLDERKGIEKVLSALKLLDKTELLKIQLVLVGVIDSEYRQNIEQQIRELPEEVIVKSVFEEVKGEKIQRYFELADYVLALYQHHVGMSQIVIRAAISQKPLISSDFGLMGKLVREKELGATTDSTNPRQIAAIMKIAVNEGISADKNSMQRLTQENSDTAFAETIFSELVI